jgi:di/tricarboxylate transporter
VTGPIMLSASSLMGVSPHAVAVATAIGCSASFLTPMAHPVNVIMMGPAGYNFSDFYKTGWPLFILCFLVLILSFFLFW